ncbi:hypothetical protein N7450_001352 [Penicillium hetheringtonii]|uniref:Uncharacterized protein n=1 Tax=Penicillium hetheringtonii TaxID=911720 RepID=A0AAD6H3F7_9EURO|nr:hypothetical protein N7450_001352 [Penicillium hetheringtonii]
MAYEHYMSNVKPGCREDRVVHMWSQILQFYFPLANGNFGIERETYASEEGRGRKHIDQVLIPRSKAPPSENKQISQHMWDQARDELQANIDKWTDRPANMAVFGVVAIGMFVKFYVVPQYRTRLEPLNGNDPCFSLSTQIQTVCQALLYIRAQIG